MNNKVIIGVVLAVLIAAGGIYAVTRNNASVNVNANKGTSNALQSLKDLMLAGRPVKCAIDAIEAHGGVSGTTYISGKMMRGDFSTTVNGKVMMSHMIVDGDTSYVWTDDQKTGFKTTITEEMKAKANVNASGSASDNIDVDAKQDYHCEPWSGDASQFRPPSGIEFKDMSEMMKGITGGVQANVNASAGAGSNASQCAACENAGQYRDQCRAALGCK